MPGRRGDPEVSTAEEPGGGTAYRIRPVRADDAEVILEAFQSAPDMARQGDVTDLASVQEYVAWLRDPSRRSFALCADDWTVGLVAIAVDEVNRNGSSSAGCTRRTADGVGSPGRW